MVLDDAYDEARHGDYFRQLAAFVCDGLNACGYVYCPGDMMASNPAWRLPLAQWAALFASWTNEPEPTALMLTCVFFDMRCVHGQATLLQRLRTQVLARSRGNTLLLAHLVANAMGRRPPLGWFGRLQTARTGEHKGTIDLKLHGIAPIVDIARIHALAIGDAAIGSHERLQATGEGAVLSEQDTRDLRDALEFLATLRIRHQARLMAEGQAPDNHLDPRAHSNFERTQLRDALRVVRDVQDLLEQRFGGGRL